jgi:hypothetical protein
VFGVSLTIRGLPVARVRADVQPRRDVRAGDVQLERRDLLAVVQRLDQGGQLAHRGAHDVGDQRDGQPGQLGQVLGQVALQPLVGQPDRVDESGRGLVEARGRVAGPRLEGDRLGDEGAEGEPRGQRIAEGAPRRDGVERPGAVDDRVRQAQAAEVDGGGQCSGTCASRSPASTGPSTHRRT